MRRRAAATLPLLVIGTAGCLGQPVSEQGAEIRWLYDLFMAAAAVVFVVVAGLIAWSIWRYRRRGDQPAPAQTHGNLKLELIWWAIPSALAFALFAASAIVLARIDDPFGQPAPAGRLTVRVDGFQWQWRFTYEELGVVVAGTPDEQPALVLPVDEPVTLVIRSEDVIHAFFVPALLIKRDAVPGMDNRLVVTLTEEGEYTGQCAEFCGLLHEQQRFSVRAVSADAFEGWLRDQRAAAAP
jgi:cytochrome c oxidase subunit II